MIKQPYQILKWYNGAGEQDYYKLLQSQWEIQQYDSNLPPSLVIKRDTRVDNLVSFGIFDLDGALIKDMTSTGVNPGYPSNWDIRTDMTFDYLVWDYFPLNSALDPGNYYYVISDGIETWYSEVWEACDYWSVLLSASTNSAPAWNVHTIVDVGGVRIGGTLTENGPGNGAENFTNSFDVIYGQKIQLFITETLVAKTGNLTVYLEDAVTLDVISDIETIAEGANVFFIEPEKTCSARFRFVLPNTTAYNAIMAIWAYWSYISAQTVLRWTDDANFCGLPFADGLNNYVILDGYPYQESTLVEETNTEDDAKNLYPLIQTVQKWYKHFIGSGVHMMEGLTMLRLMDTVTFTVENGWEIAAIDVSLDTTPHDDKHHDLYNLTLNYREDSCSKEACGFETECCCPTLANVLDTEAGGTGALPACSGGTDGDRYLVQVGGKYYIYECVNGTGWVRQTDEEERNACVYDEDADASEDNNQYWAWNPVTLEFQYICEVTGIAAPGGGIIRFAAGDILSTDEFDCIFYVQAQRDGGAGFVDYDDPITGEQFHDDGIFDTTPAAGNADFRLRIYTHNCALMFSSEYNGTP